MSVEQEVRLQRLVARHVAFGKAPAAADAWVRGTDEANAQLIAPAEQRADALVRLAADTQAHAQPGTGAGSEAGAGAGAAGGADNQRA